MSKIESAGDQVVTLNRRRGERRTVETKSTESKAAAPLAAVEKGEPRRKTNRRRQIDPTTCERDYTNDEVEFMQAMEAYKRKNGRMFPTCSEVLEVVRSLGYAKQTQEVELNQTLTSEESDTPALS